MRLLTTLNYREVPLKGKRDDKTRLLEMASCLSKQHGKKKKKSPTQQEMVRTALKYSREIDYFNKKLGEKSQPSTSIEF